MKEEVRHEPGTTHVTVYDDDGNVVERRAYSTIELPPHDGSRRLRLDEWRHQPLFASRETVYGNNRKARRAQAAFARRRR